MGSERATWRDWLSHWQQGQELHQESSHRVFRTALEVPDDSPAIAIVFSADWHLGSLATDYDQLLRDLDFLLQTPHLYLGTVGDLKDNFHSFRTAAPVVAQLASPQEQNWVLASLTRDLVDAGKLLWVCWDNHASEFDERVIGYDAAAYIWEAAQVTHLSGEGLVDLTLGDTHYTHLVTHKARYNSFLNPLHSNRRLYDLWFPADVVVTAHTHVPAFSEQNLLPLARELGYPFGGKSIFVRCGTYKTGDEYARRHYGLPLLGAPTIVYHRDSHHHLGFSNAEDAVRYLKGVPHAR